MTLKPKTSERGFSAIELIVSIFILAMLSGVLIASFRTGEKQRRVNAAADIAINALRNAQNYTLSSRGIQNSTCQQGGEDDRSPVNYRAVFNASANTIALKAEDKCANLITIETYPLPERTRIQPMGLYRTISGATINYDLMQVKFTTPFAVTQASSTDGTVGNFVNYQTVDVVLETTDGSVSKTVTVDGISGRIGE